METQVFGPCQSPLMIVATLRTAGSILDPATASVARFAAPWAWAQGTSHVAPVMMPLVMVRVWVVVPSASRRLRVVVTPKGVLLALPVAALVTRNWLGSKDVVVPLLMLFGPSVPFVPGSPCGPCSPVPPDGPCGP